MSILPDKQIIDIGLQIANANGVPAQAVSISPIVGADFEPAMQLTISITAGSSSAIRGQPMFDTISGYIAALADRGEERTPYFRFRELGDTD